MIYKIKRISIEMEKLVKEDGELKWKDASLVSDEVRTCLEEVKNEIIRYLDTSLGAMDKVKDLKCYLH
jgi:hypothetical protein